jgi:hypothetical protein
MELEPFLSKKQKDFLLEQIRLVSLSTQELMTEFVLLTDRLDNNRKYDQGQFQLTSKIAEILCTRPDWDRSTITGVIEYSLGEDFVSYQGILFVKIAGIECKEELAPKLVELLFKDLDQDVLVEEATKALIRIGTN